MADNSDVKKNPNPADIDINGSVSGSNIIIGNGNEVINTTIIQPAPETHDMLGSIPPASTETYVHRGEIEDKIRAALRKGGASAVVGVNAPGGTGKTELANCIAREVREGKFPFEDVLWLNVNDRTPQEVISEALRLCGILLPPTASDTDKKTELNHFLLTHKLLVVFDDVRANSAHRIKELLPPAPCASLITSRIQQMAGVKDFPLDRMERDQARALFVNSLGEETVQAEEEMVFTLAERCKFNPLALEIASRWIRQKKDFTNPIAMYYGKVEKRFEALQMDGDPRWNMTAVFDISYNDLTETDRQYFRALAVFAPTGFSPKAAAHIWNMDEGKAGEIFTRFINLSLVIPIKGDLERYRLHDLLDEYATLKLQEIGETEKATSELADWLINLFDEHYTDDFSNAPEVGLEFANLTKTAEWAIAQEKGNLLATLATKPRNWLYNYFRELKEWLNWLESSLKIGIEDNGLKANVLQAIGDVQQFRKETDAALESYNEALKLFRQVGDKLGEANTLQSLGKSAIMAANDQTSFEQGVQILQSAMNIHEEIKDVVGQVNILMFMSRIMASMNQFSQALELASQALPMLINAAGEQHPVTLSFMDYMEQLRTEVQKQQ